MSEERNEVHIKTYDEWLKYYKNATKEQVIEDYLKEKIEQLEECIDYIKHEIKDMPLNDCKLRLINLLNILNKGSKYECNKFKIKKL